MNLQRFTIKAQEAEQQAMEIASSRNHPAVEPAHVLKALLADGTGVTVSIFNKLGADVARLDTTANEALYKLPVVTGASVSGQVASQDLKKVFDRAVAEADLLKDE